MLIKDFLRAFDSIVPLASAGYEKDAVGLQIGHEAGAELSKVLLAYEITNEVIDEAISMKANLILCYHPLIFPSITSITDSSRTGALVRRLIENKIALYVIHTAFDSQPEFGTSAMMAAKLGLLNPKPVSSLSGLLEKIIVFVPGNVDIINQVREAMWKAGAGNIGNYDECSFTSEGFGTFRGNDKSNPTLGVAGVRETAGEVRIEMIAEKWKRPAIITELLAAHPYEEVAYDIQPLTNGHPKFGMGTMGLLPNPMTPSDLLELVSTTFETSVLRYSKSNRKIRHVGMVGGSGMEYYSSVRKAGCDAFITGDIRYHDFYRAEHDGLLLIDAGHSETERFVLDGMQIAVEQALNVVILQKEDRHRLFARSLMRPNAVSYQINKGLL
ncbi:MAG TPA: Nif3-like dinuclear metal center hexameric protein [Candidatus Kapabacteria bacterium]|nr:Nif3-like dinuclear metal center hexameric protein [Candidatus Kapabacteria bacterium]